MFLLVYTTLLVLYKIINNRIYFIPNEVYILTCYIRERCPKVENQTFLFLEICQSCAIDWLSINFVGVKFLVIVQFELINNLKIIVLLMADSALVSI